MSRKQLEFDLTKRGAKLAIIGQIVKRRVLKSRMLLVLHAVDDRARDHATTCMTYSEIAQFQNQSRETAKRGVADMIKYQLLIKTDVINSLGQQANEYQLIWSNLQALADGEPLETPAPDSEYIAGNDSEIPAPVSDYESSQVVNVGPGQFGLTPGSQRPPDPGHHDPAIYIPLSRINTPPPFNNHSWEGVVDDLKSFGVAMASKAIQSARGRGCSIKEIQNLIAYARSKPNAYGPGAIFQRVMSALPGSDPKADWPPESEAYRKSKIQNHEQKTRDQATREAAQREAKRKANKQAREDLEREYGPILDEMAQSEIQEFANQHCGVIAPKVARNPSLSQSGEIRLFLLSTLKNKLPELQSERT